MSICRTADDQEDLMHDVPDTSSVTGKEANPYRNSSTTSQLSETSSGIFSIESGICDSLTRAFRELGLREVGVDIQKAANVGGWVERSCSQAVEKVEDVDEAFSDETGADNDAIEAGEETETLEAGDENDVDEEEEEEVEPWASRSAIRRCSSLRSNCSTDSASSDGRRRTKKVVRFADSLGLDLIKVRHVFNSDSPPETEPALRRLGCRRDSLATAPRSKRRLLVSPCFPQPGGCAGFISRVMSQKVMLERAGVDAGSSLLSGQVRVCNLHYEKRVTVRITFDAWRSCSEVAAVYEASNKAADMTDQFVFQVPLPAGFGAAAGDRAALCIRYDTLGQTFWDSNYGENYAFDCLPLGWEGSDDDTLARFL